MEKEIIKRLFERKPDRWGTSGNEALWMEMAMLLAMDKAPDTAEELEKLVCDTFRELAGREMHSRELIRVERYDSGGLARGMVSGDWWLTSAIPLLLKNFEELKQEDDI